MVAELGLLLHPLHRGRAELMAKVVLTSSGKLVIKGSGRLAVRGTPLPPAPDPEIPPASGTLPLEATGATSVSHNGVTITLAQPVDVYVYRDGRKELVGPAGNTVLTGPAPVTAGGYTYGGTMLNPQAAAGQAWDQRSAVYQGTSTDWRANLQVTYPLAVSHAAGDILVVAVPVPTASLGHALPSNNIGLVNNNTVRDGLVYTYATFHFRTTPSPADSIAPAPVGWPGRGMPKTDVVGDDKMDDFLRSFTPLDLSGFPANRRVTPTEAMAKLGVWASGEWLASPTRWGAYDTLSPHDFGTTSTSIHDHNYGEHMGAELGTIGLMLASNLWTMAEKRPALLALVLLGKHVNDLLQEGAGLNPGPDGGHFQPFFLAQLGYIFVTGQTARYGIFMQEAALNQAQAFLLTRQHVADLATPHQDTSKPHVSHLRPIIAATGSTITVMKSAAYGDPSKFHALGMRITRADGSAYAVSLTDHTNVNSGAQTLTLDAMPTPPFAEGELVWMRSPYPRGVGEVDWRLAREISSYNPAATMSYRSNASWGAQVMAAAAMGMLEHQQFAAVRAYVHQAMLADHPAAGFNWPGVPGLWNSGSQRAISGDVWTAYGQTLLPMTAPAVLSGPQNPHAGSALQITFDRPVFLHDGTFTLRSNSGSWGNVETFDTATDGPSGTGRLSISGATLTIQPSAAMVAGRQYALRISAGAVLARAGGRHAGITNDTSIAWTVAAASTSVATLTHAVDATATVFPTTQTAPEVIALVKGATTAEVRFRGTVGGADGTVQIRLRGWNTGAVEHDWFDLVASSGGVFDGVKALPVCQDFWWRADARVQNGATVTTFAGRFGVGHDWAFEGQSQMTGAMGASGGPVWYTPNPANFNTAVVNLWQPGVGGVYANDRVLLLDGVNGGDTAYAFLDTIRQWIPTGPIRLTMEAVVALPAMSLVSEDYATRKWADWTAKINQHGKAKTGVIFNHGTADATHFNHHAAPKHDKWWGIMLGTETSYTSYSLGTPTFTIHHDFLGSMAEGVRFILSPLTHHNDDRNGGMWNFRSGQVGAAHALGITVGPPLPDWPLEHGNSPHTSVSMESNAVMGVRMAIAAAMDLDLVDLTFPTVTAAVRSADGLAIDLTVTLPNGGTLFSPTPGNVYGFEVSENGGAKWTVDSGDTVDGDDGFTAAIVAGTNKIRLTKDGGGTWALTTGNALRVRQRNDPGTYSTVTPATTTTATAANEVERAARLPYESWAFDPLGRGLPVLGRYDGDGHWQCADTPGANNAGGVTTVLIVTQAA
jgi:hypothetical protein